MQMNEAYHVLIVEDDFRIANIHRQFIDRIEDFTVSAAVKTGKEALTFLQECEKVPDVILLDIYIPDVEGMDLFWKIRSTYKEVDIIIITAANEVKTVQESVRGGVFDYIIKPADIDRFQRTLIKYKEKRQFLASAEELTQEEIDAYVLPKSTKTNSKHLPKGIDAITLNEITMLLQPEFTEGITAVELSKQIGTSRSTARRYLEYLVSIKKIKTKLKYGTVGRPERKYYPRETYEQNE